MSSSAPGLPPEKRIRKRIRKLNEMYLGLDLRGIGYYEYEPQDRDFKMLGPMPLKEPYCSTPKDFLHVRLMLLSSWRTVSPS